MWDLLVEDYIQKGREDIIKYSADFEKHASVFKCTNIEVTSCFDLPQQKKSGLSLCCGLLCVFLICSCIIEIAKNMKLIGKKSIFKFPLYLLGFNV